MTVGAAEVLAVPGTGEAAWRGKNGVGMDRPLRVLLVNDLGRPGGGAEGQMLAIRAALQARGHQARLFSSDAALSPGPLLADRACHGRTDLGQVLSQTINLDARRQLARELQEHPPDVVHVRMFLWQLSPAILPLLRRVPAILQAAVYKEICPTGLKLLPGGVACREPAGQACLSHGCVRPLTWASTMAQLALVRRWRGAFDVVSCLSPVMAAAYEAAGWGPVRVLPNGVDEGPARPPLPAEPLVAFAGRLAREKGVEVLIEAFGRVLAAQPQARLLVAGDGPLRAELEARAAPLGDRVEFTGHLAVPALAARLAPAWVQAVPSLWDEPFGNVSTEAMMRGTAVVASDVGGQRAILRDGRTGFLVPPGDSPALAAALGRLLGDRALAEEMGAEGRRVALAEWGREANTDLLLATYRDAISGFALGREREAS